MSSVALTGSPHGPAAALTAQRTNFAIQALYRRLPWSRKFFADLQVDLAAVDRLECERLSRCNLNGLGVAGKLGPNWGRERTVRIMLLDAMGGLLGEIPPGEQVSTSAVLQRVENECVFVVAINFYGPRDSAPDEWSVNLLCTPHGWNLRKWLERLDLIRSQRISVEAPQVATSVEAKARVFAEHPWLSAGEQPIVPDSAKVTVAKVGRFDSATFLRTTHHHRGTEHVSVRRIFLRRHDGSPLDEVPLPRKKEEKEGPTVACTLSYLEEPQQLGFVVDSHEVRDKSGELLEQQLEISRPAAGFSVAGWWARECEASDSHLAGKMGLARDPELAPEESVPFLI